MVVGKEIYKKCRDVCLSMASFMDQLNFRPTNIGLPQGFNFNLPTSIPITFIREPPPHPPPPPSG